MFWSPYKFVNWSLLDQGRHTVSPRQRPENESIRHARRLISVARGTYIPQKHIHEKCDPILNSFTSVKLLRSYLHPISLTLMRSMLSLGDVFRVCGTQFPSLRLTPDLGSPLKLLRNQLNSRFRDGSGVSVYVVLHPERPQASELPRTSLFCQPLYFIRIGFLTILRKTGC